MRFGSFTLEDTTINVDTDYDQISGRVYRFTRAEDGEQIAVTDYKGLKVADGVTFSAADLQRGLRSVRRTLRR
jgi:hypothetical protein